MKKSLISLIGLIMVIAVAATVMGFALGNGSGSPVQDPTGEITHGDPTYDEWLSDFGDGKVLTNADDIDPELILDFGDGIGDGKVLTSADDIDPDECNAVHNYNACTVEELEELGNLAAISWIVDPGTEVLPAE